MLNHLHALISFSNTGKNINTIIGNGKRFMAYDIVARLEAASNEIILAELTKSVKSSDRKRARLHEVFEHSFDNKKSFTKKFILQKLDYINWNPCSVKWNLAGCPEDTYIARRIFTTTASRGFLPQMILCK